MSQPLPPADPAAVGVPGTLARRVRLREFQSRLLERMQAARTGASADRNLLGVMIGDERWLIGLNQAGEIVQPGGIATVPLTQPWFLGLVNVRGNLVSVMDVPAFEGKTPLRVDRESRIVTLAAAVAPQSGILVSRVLGLRNVEEMEVLADVPASSTASWSAQAYVDRSGVRWDRLDLARIVADPRFLQVAL